jgi:hypothetical protein
MRIKVSYSDGTSGWFKGEGLGDGYADETGHGAPYEDQPNGCGHGHGNKFETQAGCGLGKGLANGYGFNTKDGHGQKSTIQ